MNDMHENVERIMLTAEQIENAGQGKSPRSWISSMRAGAPSSSVF